MAEQEQVKIGLVGASWFADLWYLPVVQMHPNAELYAICSEGGGSARRMADKYGIPHVFGSYEEMLEQAGLDGVCIITPNDVHVTIAEAAMNRGIHVMSEKPLALNLNEAEQMLRTAQSSGVIHGVNFTYREHPGVRRIRALVEEGLIGRLQSGHFEYTGDYGVAGPPGWRGSIAKGGIGGVLADLGSHLIDLAQYVTGDGLSEVSADAAFKHRDVNPDAAADAVIFLARSLQGAQHTFRTSWIEHQGTKGQTIRIHLIGELGIIEFAVSHLGSALSYTLHEGGKRVIDLQQNGLPAWNEDDPSSETSFRPWRLTDRNEVWKWIDRIIDRKDGTAAASVDAPTFADGYYAQSVMEAVMQAAEERRWVPVRSME
ncbi:Gfo/Idh/MocA family protein [Paenibacillus sp. 1011MAR3C5]|uniref:Gfo/Idh/MocA family protein n=1 Tax=Paenibacillus sp. 1011MAR3C5 TaxID=1675787 RepID=UPI0011C3CB71|nr:Gfo/Idh/MocA family oxidoreductase [Paenibacillus sp. 1011MAR3C5]